MHRKRGHQGRGDCCGHGASGQVAVGIVGHRLAVEKLLQFEKVHIALSIDGYGEVNDDIRFPLNWETVRKNLAVLHQFAPEKITVSAIGIVQTNNALRITRLLRFLDASGVHDREHLLWLD